MAASTDPLRRETIGIVAQDTGDRLAAPKTNPLLALAGALSEIQPTAARLADQYVADQEEKATTRAKRDAIIAGGKDLAEAVRSGRLAPTQNPWYMQAYKRESAAVRSQSALRKLQQDSASWAEKNDPEAFEKRWREEVGAIAAGFEDTDSAAGFLTAEAQVTSQVLSSNTAHNVQRITTERTQNLSALAADSIADLARARGGRVTAGELLAALAPARDQWLATGGSAEAFNTIALGALVTAATNTSNPGLLDAAKGIGLDGKLAGDANEEFGSGAALEAGPPSPRVGMGGDITPLPGAGDGNLQPTSPPLRGLPVPGNPQPTSRFGASRRQGPHNGVDLPGKHGDPIRPRAGGKVVKVVKVVKGGTEGPSGNHVVVDHGGGVQTSYSHLSRIDVKRGDVVTAGQVIGGMGSTGRSTGTHLHYVVRKDGKAVDPLSFSFEGSIPEQGSPPSAPSQAGAPSGSLGTSGPPLAGPSASAEGAPPPTPDRAPSLYDMAGVASDIEQTRYHITQAQTGAATDRLRILQAQRQMQGMEAADALYEKYGADILLGEFSVPAIIQELTQAGYSPQAVQAALSQIREGVGDSSGLMKARMEINSASPTGARSLFDLAARGRREGWSQGYEEEVGRRVLAGDITPEDGIAMVTSAHAKSEQLENQADEARREATAEARAARQEALLKQPVNNFTELGNQATVFGEFALTTAKQRLRVRFRNEEGTRSYLITQVRQTMNAYLAQNPGDWDGAVRAGNEWAEAWLRRYAAASKKGTGQRPAAGAQRPSTAGNPRR